MKSLPFHRTPRILVLGIVVLGLTLSMLSTSLRYFSKGAKYAPDPVFAGVALGRNPPSWGLNYVSWSGSLSREVDSKDFRAAYESWYMGAVGELKGTGAYLYPFNALHVTVSTPAPFPHPGHATWGAREREAYREAWQAVLTEPSPCSAPAPFQLRVKALRFSPDGTAIILWEDPSGAMGEVRKCIAARVASHPAWEASPMAQGLLPTSGLKTPSIIHSTILRLALPRDPGMSDRDLEAKWDRAAALWPTSKTLTVTSSALFLVMGNEAVTLQVAPHENTLLEVRNGG
jgi:hypothetical protein